MGSLVERIALEVRNAELTACLEDSVGIIEALEAQVASLRGALRSRRNSR